MPTIKRIWSSPARPRIFYLVQDLRDLVKAANLLLAEIAIEILQQAVQIEQRLNRIDSITSPEEKTE